LTDRAVVSPMLSSIYSPCSVLCSLFFLDDPATTSLSTLSLHDALPIYPPPAGAPTWPGLEVAGEILKVGRGVDPSLAGTREGRRSEEHTSELQSRFDLVCRLLLEKKKNIKKK